MYSATCRTKALIVSMLNVTPPFELRPEYQWNVQEISQMYRMKYMYY
jgi:hypothetical protein